MSWKQVKPFTLSKMGTTPGYCLQNVRLAFDAPSKYYDAKAAMQANKDAGTLHDVSTLPLNVAVPVFLDTASVYEHVIASDKGVFYSDGKKLTSLAGYKVFGWGETLNGARIVEWVADNQEKSDEELAREVIQGLYGNGAERKEKLGDRYAAVQALVNKMLTTNSAGETAPLKKGDRVTLLSYIDYDGRILKKTRDYYYIQNDISNTKRAVLVADNQNGPVYAAVNKNNLKKY